LIVAGFLILLSLALGYFVSPWFLLTGLVGLGLLRATFADRCPARSVFRMLCPTKSHGAASR
jgi:hypothetical protein